jgi:hypothetical protein
MVHTWSLNPAAIAGVRACHDPLGARDRNARTAQQELSLYPMK